MTSLVELVDLQIFGRDDVAAIEMSPRFHFGFVQMLGMANPLTGVLLHQYQGLPVVLVHGDGDYFEVLNDQQYRLRLKHNELLKIYNEKYMNFRNFINGAYKITNIDTTKNNQLDELNRLCDRLASLEQQITKFKK